MLGPKGNATRVMCNAICDETLDRAEQWFGEHKQEPYCYWAKDEFISITDKNNIDILNRHPEIEDIDDHTIVQWNSEAEVIRLSKFCPKLREGLKEMYENNVVSGHGKTTHWALFQDGSNYELIVYRA